MLANPRDLATELVKRRARTHGQDRIPVLDVYAKGPNLWLHTDPKLHWEMVEAETNAIDRTIHEIQKHALGLTYSDGELDWESRRAAFQAVRRAVLRESVLLRLLPSEKERDDSGWGELLVEILICTSVGQEGIDLHRHCRHVVHFDLAWNPAVMEQRTGRTDRIGSKTFRERDHDGEKTDSFLEIGVPYLAGTYDERMYEELRLRAQTFEVLTGGDLAADESEGADNHENAEGEESGLRFVPLPDSMVEALRVKLHVWSEQPNSRTVQPIRLSIMRFWTP